MKGRKILYAVISLLTVTLAGCASTFKATHDHDPAQDFNAYETYSWIAEHPMKVGATSRLPNPLLETRIMAAIQNSLGSKGYTKVDQPDSADFVLSFTVGSREEIDINTYPSMAVGYGQRGRWGGAYYGSYYGGMTETTVRQYTEGMIAIDIFDVKDHQPVWHGVASKRINDSDRENMTATVQAAVDAILAGFPPG